MSTNNNAPATDQGVDTAASTHLDTLQIFQTWMISSTLGIIGIVIWQLVWMTKSFAKTPRVNHFNIRHYEPAEKDEEHTFIFGLQWKVFKIIYFGSPYPFIERYGFDSYFYFALQYYMAVSVFFSFAFFILLTIFWGKLTNEDTSWNEIFSRISGERGDIWLDSSNFNSVAIFVVTSPLAFGLWRVLENYYKIMQDQFQESETNFRNEEMDRNQLWYKLRTTFVKDLYVDDLSSEKFTEDCVNMLRNPEMQKFCSDGEVENCITIPDFHRLVGSQITQNQAYCLKESNVNLTNEESNSGYCTKICQCFWPKYYYDDNSFKRLSDNLEKKINRVLESSTHCSSFGFVQTNTLTSSRIIKYETYMKYRSTRKLLTSLLGNNDEVIEPVTQELRETTKIPNRVSPTKVFSPSKFKIEETKEKSSTKEKIEETKEKSLKKVKIEETPDKSPEIINVSTGYESPEIFNERKFTANGRQRTGTQIDENVLETQIHMAMTDGNDESVTHPDMAAIKQRYESLQTIFCDSNPLDPDDIIWLNLGHSIKEGWVKRICFSLIQFIMFFFLSSPSAVLQAASQTFFLKEVLEFEWVDNYPSWLSEFIKQYFITLILICCNKLFLLAVDFIAEGKRFIRKVQYHKYLMKINFWYLLINIVILPGLAQSGVTSLFTVFNKEKSEQLTYEQLVGSFKLADQGNFFINFLVQTAGISCLWESVRWRDIFVLGRGNIFIGKLVRDMQNENRWMNEEVYLLPIGVKYAFFSVYIVMVAMFAFQAPLIMVAVFGTIIIYTIKDGALLICFHKKETEDFGSLLGVATRCIHFGIILSHVIMQLSCSIQKNMNAVLFSLFSLIVQWAIYWNITGNFQGANFLKDQTYISQRRVIKDSEKAEWIKMYSHPLIVNEEKYTEYMAQKPAFHKYLSQFVQPVVNKKRMETLKPIVRKSAKEQGSQQIEEVDIDEKKPFNDEETYLDDTNL